MGYHADLERNRLRLEVLLFAQVAGYAPACRIASSPTTTSVVVATGHINPGGASPGDYTNPDAGAADGGASTFKVDDKARLRRMNVAADTFDPSVFTVVSVVGTTITVSPALDAATRTGIAGGEWWTLVPAHASELVGAPNEVAQLAYAYCGDDATGVIGGTTYPNKPWSP